MKTISRAIISLIFISILLAACTSSPVSKLEGTKWKLVLLMADGVTVDLSHANQVTLEFGDKGAISGSAGCNSYFGTMKIKSNGKVTVSDVGSTEMYGSRDRLSWCVDARRDSVIRR